MIIVIDYKTGNVGAVFNMINRIGIDAKISSSSDEIAKADKLILPGVGSFDNAMKNLYDMDLLSILNRRVLEDEIPILGICLGMQLMTKTSQEGKMPGIGWVDAETVRFKFDSDSSRKIPHMGWNSIRIIRNNALFNEVDQNFKFYFAHSYHVLCNNEKHILAKTCYEYEFVSIFNSNNIFGVQFHPEKSHRFGKKILENFFEL